MAGFDAHDPHVMLLRTIIAIQKGLARDAPHTLNELGEDFPPALRALRDRYRAADRRRQRASQGRGVRSAGGRAALAGESFRR